MKTTARLVALAVLAAFTFSCATVERTESDDPFAPQLDNYYAKRQTAQTWMFACASVLAISALGGTAFTTLNSMQAMDHTWAILGIVSCYTIGAASTGFGIYEYTQFDKYFNLYLETLRLQTKYYNEIEWTKHEGGQ